MIYALKMTTYIVHPKKPETPAYLRGKLEHCGGGVGYVFA